ncbi:MAG: fumarylacetoacetate hydrolase family protein [Burkholderiales bacterium]
MTPEALSSVIEALLAAEARTASLAPITSWAPGFTVADAYRALAALEQRRRERGWRPVGRKIGFTNRTLWPRYGVFAPMWAHVWDATFTDAPAGSASVSLAGTVEPRLEPEVVFGLAGPVAATDDPVAVLGAVAWMAPGFEVVQSHYPRWSFTAADCTAAWGLHGHLVVGPRVPIAASDRAAVAARLATFEATLRRGDEVIDRGAGANVLGSPALALAHLARVLAAQTDAPPLAAGEIVTTGTLTDAWPVAAGQTWSSDYGALGIPGLRVTLG